MRILVAGSSGWLGQALAARLAADGHEVVPLLRAPSPDTPGSIRWDPERGVAQPERLNGIDAAVHLGGASLADGRWTPERKALLRSSRIGSTDTLAKALAGTEQRPSVFLCASAMGWYGDRGSERLDENSEPGRGFLAELCRDWEAACEPARTAGIRVVNLRFGLVLGQGAVALQRMLVPFRLGLGGRLGDGLQFMSWVSLADAVTACRHALRDESIVGPLNVVSPNPVSNREFTRILADRIRRPAVLPVPAFALRALFGQMADETLLASQRLYPTRLAAAGFRFESPTLAAALVDAV